MKEIEHQNDYSYTYYGEGGTDWLMLVFIVVLTCWALSGIVWLALVTVSHS